MQSLTNALSPPTHGPPRTAAKEATALAGRLQQWLAGIAGEAQSGAGQQNDIAGHILDANSAKELPAQHEAPTSSPLDVAHLAQSLLAVVTASLTSPVSASVTKSSTLPPTLTPTPVAPAAITMANARRRSSPGGA